MSTPARRLALSSVLMIAVEVCFGLYSYSTSTVLKGRTLSPLAFAWVRDVIAAAALLSAAAAVESRKAAPAFWIRKEDHTHLLLLGFLGVWGSQGCSALALANLDATDFAIFQPLMPLVALLAGMATGAEPPLTRSAPSFGKVAGLAAAVGGAVFVVRSGGAGGGRSPNAALGALFLAIQIVLGGSFPVAQKPLLAKYPPLVVSAWGYAVGLGLLSLSTATAATDAAAWDFGAAGAGAVVFAGLGASAFAYGAMSVANKLSGPLVLTAFFPLMPVTTAFFQWVGDGRVPTLAQAGGAAAIAAGLGVVLVAKAVEEARARGAAGAAEPEVELAVNGEPGDAATAALLADA